MRKGIEYSHSIGLCVASPVSVNIIIKEFCGANVLRIIMEAASASRHHIELAGICMLFITAVRLSWRMVFVSSSGLRCLLALAMLVAVRSSVKPVVEKPVEKPVEEPVKVLLLVMWLRVCCAV